jgi:hypothetical protein
VVLIPLEFRQWGVADVGETWEKLGKSFGGGLEVIDHQNVFEVDLLEKYCAFSASREPSLGFAIVSVVDRSRVPAPSLHNFYPTSILSGQHIECTMK